MFSHQSSQEETLFETIYRLAKAKDELALAKILASGACVGVFQGEYNPVMRLSEEGNIEAVEFLINKFKTSLNDAVQGAAGGGHVDLTNDLISRGASLNYAVRGAARGGHVDLTNDLISRGASLNYAVRGAARGGHVDLTNDLISRGASLNGAVSGAAGGGHVDLTNDLISRGASLNYVVSGAARGGHVDLTNDLISRGASLNYAVQGAAGGGHVDLTNDLISRGASLNDAVRGAAGGGHVDLTNNLISRGASLHYAVSGAARGGHVDLTNDLISRGASLNDAVRGAADGGHVEGNQENVLRFIFFIDNPDLREKLIEQAKAKEKNNSLDTQSFLKKSERRNKIMKEYQLDYKQAQSLLVQGSRAWLLQGSDLVRTQGVFPAEIFILISTFVLGLSQSDTNKVLMAINRKLFEGVSKTLKPSFISFLFKGQDVYERAIKVAKERCTQREQINQPLTLN